MSEKAKAQTNFIEELCKYYMTFLQSGFKSTRFPKRYIRFTNEKNIKLGIDLSKYEKFNSHIRKIANKENSFQNPISVKKGDYSVKLNSTSQDLVKKLVKQIKDKDVENKFSFSSFLGLIFYFGVGCFFSSVMWSGFIK